MAREGDIKTFALTVGLWYILLIVLTSLLLFYAIPEQIGFIALAILETSMYSYILWRLASFAAELQEYYVGRISLLFAVVIMIIAGTLTLAIAPKSLDNTTLGVLHSDLIVVSSILIAVVGLSFRSTNSVRMHTVLVAVFIIILSLASLIGIAIGYENPMLYLFVIIVEILLAIAIFMILYKQLNLLLFRRLSQ